MTDTAKPTPGIWMPIATLPNKSGIYLVCDSRTQDIWVAAYNDGRGTNKDSWGDDRAIGWVGYTWGANATHWMPLPPFPDENPTIATEETNLTPRQLLERVRELEAVRDDLRRTLTGIRDTFGTVHAKRLSLEHWSAIAQAFAQHADDALAKHGEGV